MNKFMIIFTILAVGLAFNLGKIMTPEGFYVHTHLKVGDSTRNLISCERTELQDHLVEYQKAFSNKGFICHRSFATLRCQDKEGKAILRSRGFKYKDKCQKFL